MVSRLKPALFGTSSTHVYVSFDRDYDGGSCMGTLTDFPISVESLNHTLNQ